MIDKYNASYLKKQRALARNFRENEDEWGLTARLHDIDVELTNADLKIHYLP